LLPTEPGVTLDNTPRNATVAALTGTMLVAVDREPFLVALTGHAQTRERLEHVASQRLTADDPEPGLQPAG
jgi:CRP-like cAMP-binding protein